MVALRAFILMTTLLPALANPTLLPADQGQGGTLITAPPRQDNLEILPIPDPAHPFRSPGPKDIRGPCPGLNTLANHGYIPRHGVATFEEIVTAVGHAFNMDYDLASQVTALGMLARGNAYINKLSIGLHSPLVPPLPGKIDGPLARGLGAHGRFEGDVSMTRQDAGVGDNVNFDPKLYKQLLDFVARYGDNSTVTGPRSVVNMRVMQEFKLKRFLDDQAADKKLQFHAGRVLFSYGETSFALNFFANGTNGLLSVPTMTSFFRDQRFPANWHRNQGDKVHSSKVFAISDKIMAAHPVAPGANDASGTYVQDPGQFDQCSAYKNLVADNLPGVLLNTTGLLRQNVDFLVGAIQNFFSNCPRAVPGGPANV